MRAIETSSGHHLQAVVRFIFLMFLNCGRELCGILDSNPGKCLKGCGDSRSN
jgi:hypothetical protein